MEARSPAATQGGPGSTGGASAWAERADAGPAPGWSYGGFWIRLVAYVIDSIIASIVAFVPLVAAIGLAPGNDAAARIALLIYFVVTIFYLPFFWGRGGQTPGMRLFGLRVVRARDGSLIGFGRALLRYLGMIIASIPLFLGLIWAGFDRKKQGWHDKIADTVVIRPAR